MVHEHWMGFETIEAAYDDLVAQLAAMTAERDEVIRANHRWGEKCKNMLAQLTASEAARGRYKSALHIIAGDEQCIDNLMSNPDVARAALAEPSGGARD